MKKFELKDIDYFHISMCLNCDGFACHIVLKNKDGIVICNHCEKTTFYPKKYVSPPVIEPNTYNRVCMSDKKVKPLIIKDAGL